MGKHRINDYEKCSQINDNFDDLAAGGIRHDAHRLMITWWRLHAKPLDAAIGRVRRIALVAAMVDNFKWDKKNTKKHNFYLAFSR